MKGILILGAFPELASIERYVGSSLALRLPADEWRVFMASRKNGPYERLVDMLRAIWAHRHDYSLAQVAVFSGRAFVWAELVCGLLRMLGKPYVLTLHGGELGNFAKRWPVRVRRLLNSARAVTCPSQFLIGAMSGLCQHLRYIPNPIEVGIYPFVNRARSAPLLVWLRAFHQIYNPSLGPRVLAMLKRDFPGARLTMIGPDKGDGSLQKTLSVAESLDLGEAFSIVPGVPKTEVPVRLGGADIFLNTTDVDNTPVSLLEAMACGLPVVSTDVGGIPHLITHGVTGVLVPPNDPHAMAAAISGLLRDSEYASRLSVNGRKLAEACDWSIVLPQWTSLFHEALGREYEARDGISRV